MWQIRRGTKEDSPAMVETRVAAIRDLGGQSYSPEVIEAWQQVSSLDIFARVMDRGEAFFLAEEAGEILGFAGAGLVPEPHLGAYVRGSAARKGIGSALIQEAETWLRGHGASEIKIQASLLAVPFYEKHGFEKVEISVHEFRAGVRMECMDMIKKL